MKRLFALLIVGLLAGCTTWETWTTAFNGETPLPDATRSPHPVSLNDLFLHPVDCELPCFGGLIPGRSSDTDVTGFVERFAARYPGVWADKNGINGYYGTSMVPEPAGHLGIAFLVENQRLLRTDLTLSRPYQWIARLPVDLPTLLAQLGQPDEVLLLFGGPSLFFDLYLVYADQGLMVSYYALYQDPDIVGSDTPLLICLQPHIVDLQQVEIWLEDPLNGTFIDEELPKIKEERDIRPLWDIERLGGVSTADFTNFFIEHPQGCLPIKSASDLREIGYVF